MLERTVILYRLLLVYLVFVMYLFLANWIGIANLASLPLSTLPASYPFFMMLLGIIAATLLNTMRKRQKASQDKST